MAKRKAFERKAQSGSASQHARRPRFGLNRPARRYMADHVTLRVIVATGPDGVTFTFVADRPLRSVAVAGTLQHPEWFQRDASGRVTYHRQYQREAELRGCPFLDAGQIINSRARDGIHFEADVHQALGHAVARLVRELLGAKQPRWYAPPPIANKA